MRQSEVLEGYRDDGPSDALNIAVDHFRSTRYRLRLEVRVPGEAAHEVEGEFKVPNRSLGAFGNGGVLAEGIEVPVLVHDGGGLEIDWDAYKADPGREEAQKAAQQSRKNAHLHEQLKRNPKQYERMRAQGKMKLEAWSGAVRAGSMSREIFESTVRLEVETGRIDAAEADAALKALD